MDAPEELGKAALLESSGDKSARHTPSLLTDVVAVVRHSTTDPMFMATLFGFVLMLLYTMADAHKAWEAAHQLTVNICMACLCWAFLPAVMPFIRVPWQARGPGTRLQAAGWILGLLADYTLLLGTVAFAVLGVLLFLSSRAPSYMVALLVVECVGCWGFLLSACAYAASWVLGALPEPQGEAKDVAHTGAPTADPGPDPNNLASAAATTRALALTHFEWWAHALNIGGSFVYVLASTSSVLLVLAPGQDVPMQDAQTALRQDMAQSFVIGDVLWTCDAAVFLGIWAREALKAQRAKVEGGGGSKDEGTLFA